MNVEGEREVERERGIMRKKSRGDNIPLLHVCRIKISDLGI